MPKRTWMQRAYWPSLNDSFSDKQKIQMWKNSISYFWGSSVIKLFDNRRPKFRFLFRPLFFRHQFHSFRLCEPVCAWHRSLHTLLRFPCSSQMKGDAGQLTQQLKWKICLQILCMKFTKHFASIWSLWVSFITTNVSLLLNINKKIYYTHIHNI